MKNCWSCGAQLDDGAGFCSRCGSNQTAVGVQPNNYGNMQPARDTTMVTRINAMQELGNVYNYFLQKLDLYNEYDAINYKIQCLEHSSDLKVLLIFGIILAFPGALMLGLSSGINIIARVFFALFFFWPLILYCVLITKNKSKIQSMLKRLGVIANELTRHYNAYGYCPIGPEYSNPAIIDGIMRIIRSGRADTIKEALNVMLNDAHKTTMELAAMQTANSARSAAAGATAAAVFNAASFFF